MYPNMVHELTRIKVAERQEDAARQRLAKASRTARRRQARPSRAMAMRLRLGRMLIRVGTTVRGTPAGSGA